MADEQGSGAATAPTGRGSRERRPKAEQLAWEARVGRFAAAAAIAAVALTVGNIVFRAVALERPPDDDRASLVLIHRYADELLVLGISQAVILLLVAVVLWFLYQVTSYRRPETPSVALMLAVLAPVLSAIATVLLQIDRVETADDFVATGIGLDPERTEETASKLLDDAPALGTGLGAGGTLGLAICFVLLGVNGIRAGVVSRFIGVIGVIVGILYVLPLIGGPLVIQIFWLGALSVLFLGRWPGGRGPAWSTGEAIPWPSGADRRPLGDASPPDDTGATDGAEPDEPGSRRAANRRKKKGRRR